jgi:uncharacterized protein YdgA (DUF945 family)
MKKSLAGVPGVATLVVAAWLGATWYTGKRIEDEAPARLTEVNQRLAQAFPACGVKLEQIGFERGFFSTHARYEVTASGKVEVPKGVVQIDAVAHHGPFPLPLLESGRLVPEMAEVHAELVKTDGLKAVYDATHGKTPFQSDTILSYGGDSRGTVDVAPADVEFEGHKLAFGATHVQGEFARKTQSMQSVVRLASLSLDGADLGSGEATIKADGQSLDVDPIIWKTDKGESHASVNIGVDTALAGAAHDGDALPRAIKTVAAKVALSKPMLGEVGARLLAATQGLNPQDAQRQAARQIAGLSGVGQILGLVRNEGDNLVSELRYADGKISLNGRERDVGSLIPALQ